LYTSIDSTPLKDIFDLVGCGQYWFVGSVCKEWNAVYWQRGDHDWKMETFWHNQQSSKVCMVQGHWQEQTKETGLQSETRQLPSIASHETASHTKKYALWA
jgi:hypothetical protein